jgi:hypothetical protein
MAYSIKEISSLTELINELENDFTGYGGSVWYRGQTKESYTLLPSYLRNSNAPETTLLSAFKQNASMLTSTQPNNKFDWMFLMQHYGIPTRLLDWSESPLIALFFALRKIEDNSDAVVWALKPTELNKNAKIKSKEEEFYIPSFEDDEIIGYSIESLISTKVELSPAAVIATRNNPRIQAQMGVFTIHHHEKISIEDIGEQTHMVKYIIKKDSKKNILKQIEILGITEFQLFPELASIKSILKKRGVIS